MAYGAKTGRKILKAIGFVKTIKAPKEDEELLETIRQHVQLDAEATEHQRRLELEDLRFLDPSTQWTDEERRSREGNGRPCLTEDRLGPFHRQICNEQRKNKPGGQVNPVDSGSDVDTAEIIQGLIRHIEYSSNADTAYDTAFWWSSGVGRGFYRLTTDYVDNETDDQEILIKRVPNPHSVFIDPAAIESDFSDMKWGGFKTWMSRSDFKEQYPDAELAGAGNTVWQSIGDDCEDWMAKDGSACMVVEYFYKKFTKGKTASGRETIDVKVCWVKCTAVEILECGELPGVYIPIIAVLGEEKIVDGHRTWSGIVRAGKDPQRRHNYLLTSQVERLAFMPIATFMGGKGFMGKDQAVWANAHRNPMAALEFESLDDNGQPIEPPQFITAEAPIMAVTNAMVGAEEGMKAVLGMYDANIGNRQGSESGVAIQRLQAQGDTGNYHLQDNLGRAIRYEIRIILSWLPTYYDTPRVIRIIGEDGTQSQVKINSDIQNEKEALRKDQIGKAFNLTTGKYDVTVSTGPSYQSKREEDRAILLGMLNGPMGELVAARAGDLVAKTLDSPIAKELAKRLVPPDIAAKEQGGAGQEIPPQIQQQLQQSGQMIEQLTAKVNEQASIIESKQAETQAKIEADMAKAQLDSQTKIQIAQMDNEAKILIAEAQISGNSMIPELQAELAELRIQQEELAELALQTHGAMSGMKRKPMEMGESPEMESPGMMPVEQPAGLMAGMEESNA